jgi:deoxyribonuclease-1-like protein
MKLAAPILAALATADNCGDLATDATFQTITNAVVKDGCTNASGDECLVKCSSGNLPSHFGYNTKATCTCANGSCGWNYGSFGSGTNSEQPNFGCCKANDKSFGTAWSKSALNRNWGKKFVEANESYALLGFKIKAKMASSNGYSFMMIWNGILPEDVEFEGFTRFVVQKIFRDQASSQTFVMLTSNTGYDTLATGDKFTLSVGVKRTTGGTTDIKALVKATNYKVKFYDGRQTSWCAGNDALAEFLDPAPVFFSSFNIQVFGTTKYGKTEVKNQIVEILERYDISTIQEIRDSSLTAFPNLVADMNANEDKWDYVMGARQGSTSSKEQEGFIWDRNKFSLEEAYDFDDTQGWFERPPTIAYFNRLNPNAQTQKFMIISTHIKPESGSTDMTTEDEINHLEDVYNDAIARRPDYADAIIAGDMNADCTYVADPETTLNMYSDPNWTWTLEFDVDTTVKDTDCAYDHIVLRGPNIPNTFTNAAVFDYQTFYGTDNIFYQGDPITDLVSDHFPVEMYFD